jgi:hypothetical protein
VETVKLADKTDAYNFTKGLDFVLDNATWRPVRWTDRLRWRVRELLRLHTYSRVVDIDHKSGIVTLEVVRWSWLRWRWERV